MRAHILLCTVLVTVAASLAGPVVPARAEAPTDLGMAADNGAECGGEFDLVQYADPAAGPTYRVPYAGRLTSWSTYGHDGSPDEGTRAFEVWRPTAGPYYAFTLVSRTAPVDMGFTGLRTYPLSPPVAVQAGDLLGFQSVGSTLNCFSGASGVVGSTNGLTAVGGIGEMVLDEGLALNVSAHLVPPDVTAPVITPHPDLVVPSMGTTTVVSFTPPEATDDSDGPVPVVCSPPSGTAFPNGTTTVTCRATDAAGNTATSSFWVTVQGRATADLSAVLSGPTRTTAGATVTYTLTVTNRGPAPTAARIGLGALGLSGAAATPAAPIGVVLLQGRPVVGASWYVPQLAPGASAVFRLTGTAAAVRSILAVGGAATVGTPDPVASNNLGARITYVRPV